MSHENNLSKITITRRDFIKTSIKSLLAIAVSGPLLFNRGYSKGMDEVKIGYIPITDASPLLVAHALNLFKEEGLKVKRPVLIRSWSALVEAFLSGKVNLVHLLLPIPIWLRYNNGTPVKIIAWNHTNGSALTIGEDSDIKTFSDLGGKQIAVPYWYSMHNVILQLGLRKHGLKPVIKPQTAEWVKNEVNLFILPPPEMPLALAGNKIDGYIVAEPFNALAEVKMNAKILRFTGDIWKSHPCCTVVVKESMIKSSPVFTQKITNAIVRAQHWILKNRSQTAKILSKDGKNYLPVPEKVLLRVFNGYELEKYGKGNTPEAIKHPEWKMNRIGFQPYPFPSTTRFIFNEMRKTIVAGDNSFLKKYSSDFVSDDLVDVRFVKNAIMNIGRNNFPDLNLEDPWTRKEIIDV